jgi:hypothetical protein
MKVFSNLIVYIFGKFLSKKDKKELGKKIITENKIISWWI